MCTTQERVRVSFIQQRSPELKFAPPEHIHACNRTEGPVVLLFFKCGRDQSALGSEEARVWGWRCIRICLTFDLIERKKCLLMRTDSRHPARTDIGAC